MAESKAADKTEAARRLAHFKVDFNADYCCYIVCMVYIDMITMNRVRTQKQHQHPNLVQVQRHEVVEH
jgi:hypothetical protein